MAARRRGIGASDAAAALGESPWVSPYQLWGEKTGLVVPEPLQSEPADWGLVLEAPIAKRYGERSGRRVELIPPNTIYQHDTHGWLLASPDAQVFPRSDETGLPDTEGSLQVKTAGVWTVDEDGNRVLTERYWSEFGPPLHYQIQLQHELLVTGWDWGCLIVLIGGQRLLGPFDVLRDDNIIDGLFAGLAVFWDHVLSQTPPDLDATESTARALARMFPEDNGDAIHLSRADEAAADEYAELGKQIKALESKRKLLRSTLVERMGEAAVGILPGGGHLTLRTITKAPYTVQAQVYRMLRRSK